MSPASPFPTLGGTARRRSGDALPTLGRCALPCAAILLSAVWPITDVQRHAHWGAVELVPFTRGWRLSDLALTLTLFFVFGAAFGRGGTTTRRLQRATAWGFVCALVAETSQVFTHTHVPALVDLAIGTAAAWCGAYVAVRRHRAWLAAEGDDPFAV